MRFLFHELSGSHVQPRQQKNFTNKLKQLIKKIMKHYCKLCNAQFFYKKNFRIRSFFRSKFKNNVSLSTSSIARGATAPHWPKKYAKYHAFSAFEADFSSKNENSPPDGIDEQM